MLKAVVFNDGYGQFPAASYFNPNNFTYMIWVKPLSYNKYQKIITFGDGNNYIATFFRDTSGSVGSFFCINGNNHNCIMNDEILINEWAHITIVSESLNMKVFYNGKEICSYTTPSGSFSTSVNYIGKSFNSNDALAHITIDELKIFDRALSVNEIESEMNQPQPYKIILNWN